MNNLIIRNNCVTILLSIQLTEVIAWHFVKLIRQLEIYPEYRIESDKWTSEYNDLTTRQEKFVCCFHFVLVFIASGLQWNAIKNRNQMEFCA